MHIERPVILRIGKSRIQSKSPRPLERFIESSKAFIGRDRRTFVPAQNTVSQFSQKYKTTVAAFYNAQTQKKRTNRLERACRLRTAKARSFSTQK